MLTEGKNNQLLNSWGRDGGPQDMIGALRKRLIGMPVDPVSVDDAVRAMADRPTSAPFEYVVTPNVDHIVRLNQDRFANLTLYDNAWLSTCDSRILGALGRIVGMRFPIAAGCDLVQRLLSDVIRPGDAVTVIGCEPEVIERLKAAYPIASIAHYNPPQGFIHDPEEVDRCVAFAVAHPARFVFFAVGSPQQEMLARRYQQTDGATGIGLCIGAALHVAAGLRSRGPVWARSIGLEWLMRLGQEPGRLWRRYLIEGPKVLVYFIRHHFLGMQPPAASTYSLSDPSLTRQARPDD